MDIIYNCVYWSSKRILPHLKKIGFYYIKMCGIFFYKNGELISSELEELLMNYLNRIQHRGPDDTSYVIIDDKFIGFHRLAINWIKSSFSIS